MIFQRFLALAAVASLAACGSGIPPVTSTASTASTALTASQTAAPVGASRTSTGLLALPGNGTLALPGNGTLALPGNGTLALPGNGTLALPGNGTLALPGGGTLMLPGNGTLALPGNGTLALPGGNLLSLLASLLNALPVCSVTSLVIRAAQCNALLNTAIAVIPNPALPVLAIPGLHPADLQSAYRIPSGGAGRTVAVIDAGDDPTAEADLAVYRTAFGMPACTSANGCFQKVGQSGSRSLPAVLTGWPQETGIDIEMISAVCASCNILLVEANSANTSDLAAAVDTAVALGANAVSNSYYAPEYSDELADETHFNHPGIAITVASGDTGYGTTFPASSRYVTAVGGTTLLRGGGTRGWSETVWGATGSGCSSYVPKPAWQHDTGCSKRTVADVAVIGNPASGVAVYNTTAAQNQRGWGVYGGTSVGAPIVAAMYAIAGNAPSGASLAYASTTSFFGVVSGSNGTCSPSYLCTAGAGYNGPGGLGTPNGINGL